MAPTLWPAPQPIIKREQNAILSFLDISRRLNAQEVQQVVEHMNDVPLEKMPEVINQLEEQMKDAAKNLEFEQAALIRDQIKKMRKKLLGERTEISN